MLNSWIDAGFFALSCWLFTSLRRRKHTTMATFSQSLHYGRKIEAHTMLAAFVSEIDARNFVSQRKCSPYTRDIGSEWVFKSYENYESALSGLSSSSPSLSPRDSFAFPTSRVANSSMPQPVGYYSCYFNIPADWATREVRLLFPSVSDSFELWINGHAAGYSEPCATASEYIVEDFLKFGSENKLEILATPIKASYTEQCHMFSLDSLLKHTSLLSLPRPVRVSDFRSVRRLACHVSPWFEISICCSWNIDDAGSLMSHQGSVSVTVDVELTWDPLTCTQVGTPPLPHLHPHPCHISTLVVSPIHTILTHVLPIPHTLYQDPSSEGIYPRCNFRSASPDWFLCTQIFEEGIMVGSSRDPAQAEALHRFVFDRPCTRAVSKVREFLFSPGHLTWLRTSPQSFDDRNLTNDDGIVFHPSNVMNVSHSHQIKNPSLWSPDRPHTYTLVVSLHSCTDGEIVQCESCRIALRVVDVKDGLLRLNARPVMIRGVNSHGMLHEADIHLMKRSNVNALRIQSKFYDSLLYELCTLYGLYVVDETSMPLKGFRSQGQDDEVGMENMCLHGLSQMYEAAKNHPCIIIWSLGVNGTYEKIHDKMAQWLRKR